MAEQVIAYVDGFNFYFGLREKGWQKYYWVNPWLVCKHLLRAKQILSQVKYFTSRIRGNEEKVSRQDAFLRAIRTEPAITVKYGRYGRRKYTCESCNYEGTLSAEKMTDVRIACEVVNDAHRDIFKTALLVSGDRDLVPIAELINQRFLDKRVLVAFPPMRTCADYNGKAGILHITERILQMSLFPNEISLPNGSKIIKPTQWA
jgi:uncharacterized LabA/DUF88 family protein